MQCPLPPRTQQAGRQLEDAQPHVGGLADLLVALRLLPRLGVLRGGQRGRGQQNSTVCSTVCMRAPQQAHPGAASPDVQSMQPLQCLLVPEDGRSPPASPLPTGTRPACRRARAPPAGQPCSSSGPAHTHSGLGASEVKLGYFTHSKGSGAVGVLRGTLAGRPAPGTEPAGPAAATHPGKPCAVLGCDVAQRRLHGAADALRLCGRERVAVRRR